jgi:hypothetical protein
MALPTCRSQSSVDFPAVFLGKKSMDRVPRREFLIAAGALVAAPLAAEVQQVAKVVRIGILAGDQAASPYIPAAMLARAQL